MSTAGQTSKLVRTERTPATIADFAAELQKLEARAESINGLVYGDSNVGKTVLAGTTPGRNLWLVCEPGYKSAGRHGATGMVRQISNSAIAWAAIEWLEHKRRYEKLGWVIVDGATTMQDQVRLGYAAEAFDINPRTRQHRNLPDRPDYFNTQNFLKAWIARLIDMPVNVLVTAHAYRTDKTENGELLVFPGFQGKVTETANAVAGLMDFVGYFEARRVRNKKSGKSRIRRRLYFESPENDDDVRYICGDKFDVLGPYIDNPTMPAILEKINGSGEDG